MTAAARMRAACPLSAWSGEPGLCGWCNNPISPGPRTAWCADKCRRAFQRNHVWTIARANARRRAKYTCSRPGCDAGRPHLEINHIDPRNGGGYADGCAHHADNLEALCREHHVAVTNEQRAARLAAHRGSGLQR
ncbi:MAG: hypothetical protein JWM93_1258 [Frankiales bacterium]|nr:hypothetical protein [Frankiales bacterium]